MAPHSSTLAWKIPWMEEPGRPQFMSRIPLSDFTFTFHCHALEKEMATHCSVLAWGIPGTGELVGCRLWGRTESDTTERLHFHFHALGKEMAPHSSVLAWRIPGTGELVGCRLRGCTESDTTEAT